LGPETQLNNRDKFSGLGPETQLNSGDKLGSSVVAKISPKSKKSSTSKPCFTPPIKQPSANGVPHLSPTIGYPSCPTPLRVPSASPNIYPSSREKFELPRDNIGALDLSLTHRQEVVHHDPPFKSSSRHVANPPVLDKLCRPPLCLSGPAKLPLKMPPPPVPHSNTYSRKGDIGRNHRYRSGTLTVINPDPNSYRPKIVIKNLDPRPDHSHHNHRT
ncbi:uncharacterized protein LOC111084722, partial [Limulus polyphemus]|uniref:Uncharacterized protein LOC111084722 n=1 Tax=Limulus polyphemus TaxID=6850 RepID=A0ABM1S072_LIMPO